MQQIVLGVTGRYWRGMFCGWRLALLSLVLLLGACETADDGSTVAGRELVGLERCSVLLPGHWYLGLAIPYTGSLSGYASAILHGIELAVDEINEVGTNIGDLNDKIVRNLAVGLDSTDLLDKRDQGLDKLAELLDMRFFARGDGDMVVFTSGGRTLVDNVSFTLSHSAASSVGPGFGLPGSGHSHRATQGPPPGPHHK